MRPRLFDTVVTLRDIPEVGIGIGTIGVIVAIFDEPDEAYEVEFADEEGRTIAQTALRSEDFELQPATAAIDCNAEGRKEDR